MSIFSKGLLISIFCVNPAVRKNKAKRQNPQLAAMVGVWDLLNAWMLFFYLQLPWSYDYIKTQSIGFMHFFFTLQVQTLFNDSAEFREIDAVSVSDR